ncbi:MAG: LysM peptidoglycan-binding domain-containing protein [Bryobacteraceae bacterium]
MGWTIIKEIEWAKQFHVDSHFGKPTDNFGAQWRFVGLVVTAEAKMQAQHALQVLKNDQGLIANSDGAVDWAGQWVMLEALSDLAGTLAAPTMPHSASNRYADPDAAAMFRGAADMLFGALASRQPADTEEFSLATQTLAWYAANTANAANRAQALTLASQFGNALIVANKDDATRKAFAIRGLLEAYRLTNDARYRTAAADVFQGLAAEYDPAHGIFGSQNSYTIDNVAVILGALNSLKLFGGDAVDQDKVEAIFTGFFESVVNLSGLQQSAPPKDTGKDKFEQESPDIYYAYPGMPMPPMAGGEFGVAPVFATEVRWEGGKWSVVNPRFDSAGAMHASNEFIWFHNDEVDGFPVVKAAAAPGALPVTGARTYTVTPGDSLYRIAAEQLGAAARWPEIYRLNQAVIGANPRLIHPGQVLVLPN